MSRLACTLLIALVSLTACSDAHRETSSPSAGPEISGRVEEGLRVLLFDTSGPPARLTIFRGDYIRPELAGGGAATIEIPELGVSMALPVPEGERAYFKVPEAGSYTVHIGDWSAVIEAIDYADARYRELSAREAARILAERDPFVLDVRTPREFAAGHLEQAVLVPVQILDQRLGELEPARGRPILVYCRTGNRSTVAARMLNEAGFGEVYNLRHGIVEWQREGLPVVR